MSYVELLAENCQQLKDLHARCTKMLNSELPSVEDSRIKSAFCKAATQQEIAQNLYQLCVGFLYYTIDDFNGTENWFIAKEFKMHFESLEELDLKLTIRGY